MSHDPTEHAQEHIQHEASHGHGPGWITAAALTAAFLAAFAAVSSSLATSHLTASTLKRIDSNDKWLEYDSDSVKRSNIYTRDGQWVQATQEQRVALAKQHEDDQKKKAEYATLPEHEAHPDSPQGMKGIQEQASTLKEESAKHLETHETYEMSATMFHIAIAVVAISVVARRKEFWYMSIVGGVVGLYFFGAAFAHAPMAEEANHGAEATQPASAATHASTTGAGDHAGSEAGH